MAKFKPQYRRLLFIDRKIREGGYPNCVSLGAEWEVSAKTIQRDIDYLRDELEAPVAYDRLRHGYTYTEPSYSLPAIRVSESDLFSVCVAETVLRQYRNTPLFRKLSSVFQRVRDSLPDKTAVNPAWLSEHILVFPEPATRIDPAVWDTLARAIHDNRRVRIRHRSPRGKGMEELERTVDPYYLVSYRGEWYLSGHCHLRRSIRTFGVSRISEAAVLDEASAPTPGMTASRMFGDQFGIIWKDAFHKVRIRFTAGMAPYIRERQWHPAQRIKEERKGGLVLEFTTNHLNEVKDWVLSWGEGATALAPRILVARVRSSLRAAAANYRRLSLAVVTCALAATCRAAPVADPAEAWREVGLLTNAVPGFRVLDLPAGSGTVTLRAEQSLTADRLRGLQLDPAPPRLGTPGATFRELTAHLESRTNLPYVARGIRPFRFRYFDAEFHYDGQRQTTWPICEYAATHGFNRLSLYRVNPADWGHLPPGTDWAKVSSYPWSGWFKARNLEPNRWDKLAEAVEAGQTLIPEGRMKPIPGFSRYMVDLEFGGLLPLEDLRQQPWYPARSNEAARTAFERRYYAGYALAFSEPGRAAHRDGWKVVSIYAWQSFRRTWYGLDPRIRLDLSVPWVRQFIDGIYDAYDIIHLDGYCYEWSPRNAAFTLLTSDEGLAYAGSRPMSKPVRLYFSTVVLNRPACGPWLRVQPLPDEEVRAIVALQGFTGADGIVQWCFAGGSDPTRPPDLAEFARRPLATNVVQVGRAFRAPDESGGTREFRRYDFLRILSVDTNAATARFIGIRPDTPLEEQPPGREQVCSLSCADLTAALRAVSEPVAAYVEGLALIRALEYTLRHGEPRRDTDMRRAWEETLPIVRRVRLGTLHVLATYDPAVVHGRPARPLTIPDFDGRRGLTLTVPADDQIRLFLLQSPR